MPTEFANVTAVAKANVYFDGKVVSHTLKFADGSKKTLGLIHPGSFHFNTAATELMQIIDGRVRAKLPGADWKTYNAPAEFRVPAHSAFDIAVDTGIAQYICSFE
ncbi:MAG: pyrimidine/purine nucleoside phosphorylase [Phycisphaerales bacterium]